MMKKMLIINAGSSSIKWVLFNDNLTIDAKGRIQRIKMKQSILELSFENKNYEEIKDLPSFLEAVKNLIRLWKEHNVIKDYSEIKSVAFRVVNGGPFLRDTCEVTEKAICYLKDAIDLAPVHNPGVLETIDAFLKLLPNVKMTMHFDTSFHKTLDKVAYSYPINAEIAKKYNIRKYGFHGLNHHYITEKIQDILHKKTVNLVCMHIGNGASLCAIKDSKSIDTSMGFTPLAGVMMGTRSGDIDPSIIPYIMQHANMSLEQVMYMLNHNSGLLGVSKVSADMRDIEEHLTEEDSKFAYDLYISRISDYLIKYINKLGKNIDALVFTAGVVENNSDVRKNIIKKISLLDLEIDDKLNDKNDDYQDYKLISSKKSQIPIYVIRANEEVYIAKEARNFLSNK